MTNTSESDRRVGSRPEAGGPTRLRHANTLALTSAMEAVLPENARILTGRTDGPLTSVSLPDGYQLREHDGETLAFDNCVMDAAIATNPSPSLLREYRRVLVPGGYLLASVDESESHSPFRAADFEPVVDVVIESVGASTLVVLSQTV
ncbi:hypothetical protein [Haloarchaeobius sp. DFWS5]|uniref:hypothetical protein n=1 Tax=Haloarchaeobius sp. DFWS5 TaxID=3446114 RepID=UPI003EB76C8D